MIKKKDFIKKVAENSESSFAKAELIINETIKEITSILVKGESIIFPGFGTFETRGRAERKGHNPSTGKDLIIPARIVPVFKPSKILKAAVDAEGDKK